ncbi:MAG: choice-of-anchor D domain-containing protein, partial [Flavobacteriales bacterium]|nr:choice-of-anchor D domain-containing protein [Flavobacteriales bacterium]
SEFWTVIPDTGGTIPFGDSTVLNVFVSGVGINSGNYKGDLVIYSNDPFNPVDTIPVTMIINGAPNIGLSDTCLYLDSIIELTTSTDTFRIMNTGCDTLFISDANNNLAEYTLSDTTTVILPGDSAEVVVTFAPMTSGTYLDTVTIINNDTVITLCLSGYGIPRPTISFSTDSLNVTITSCCDSTTDSVTVYNTGGFDLTYEIVSQSTFFDDFESGLSLWTTGGPTPPGWGVAADPFNGVFSLSESPIGNYTNNRNGYIETASQFGITDATTANLSYYLKYNTESCCDRIRSQISVNGAPYITLESLGGVGAWALKSFSLTPFVVNGDSVRIRFEFTSDFSVVAAGINIDDVSLTGISILPTWLTASILMDTVAPLDSSIVDFEFFSCGLSTDIYTADIIVLSNDPVTPIDTISLTFEVIGEPIISVSDTCLYLDSIVEFSSFQDSFRINNIGCDTLFISDANNLLPEYTLSDTAAMILPGDSITLTVTFSPLAAGFYQDTIKFINNDTAASICLYGYAYPRPVINYDPDTFNVSITTCNDTLYDTLIVSNSGLSDLIFDTDFASELAFSGSFDGSNDYIDVGAWSPGATWTLEAWVRPSSTPGGRRTIVGGMNSCLDWGIAMSNGEFALLIRPGACSQTVLSGVFAVPGTWYHIAGTNDGTNARMYVNGQLMATAPVDPFYTGYSGSTRIGSEACCGGNSFPGLIDEVRVWNVAHSEGQIQATMNATLSGGEPSLMGYWNFDDSTATDLSSSGFNGTFVNGASLTKPDVFANSTWITMIPDVLDTLAPNDSATIVVMFVSTGLITGTYADTIILSSNDPLSPLDTIPVTFNFTGYPLVGVSDTCVNLDSIFQFTSDVDSLYIRNDGCDTLFITGITSSSVEFTVDTTVFTLLPSDSQLVQVTFAPLGIGAYAESLTIFNSDADTVICLTGFALSPPIISFSPDTFLLTSTVCNDTVRDTLTIYNTGVNDLIYNIISSDYSAQFDASPEYIQIPTLALPANYTVVAWALFPLPVTGGGWRTLFQTGANQHHVLVQSTGLLGVYNFGFNSCGFNVNTLGAGWHFVTAVGTGTQTEFFIDGVSVGISTTKLTSGINYLGNYNGGNQNFGNADEFRIWNYDRNAAQIQNSMSDVLSGSESGLIGYWNFDDQTADDLSVSGNDGTLIGGASIIQLNAPVGLIEFNVTTDTVSFLDSSKVEIEISTFGLITGTYYDTIIITSNDPLSLSDTIPVILTVVGYPAISVSDTCLDFDTIFQFDSTSLQFTVYNKGCDTLFTDSITSTLSAYSVDIGSFTLPVGDSILITATFSPIVLGAHTDTFVVHSNDSNMAICLVGVAIPPPIISTIPDSIDLTITECTDTVIQPIIIKNTGGFTLYYTIDTVGFMGFIDSLIDTVNIGDSTIVNVLFDATALSSGTYLDSFIIISNDPVNTPLIITTELTITPVPATPSSFDSTICFGDANPAFIATGDTGSTGDTIYWFSDLALTTPVDTGDSFTPADVAVGAYTYYFAYNVDSCNSLPDSITLTINTGPIPPTAADTGACFGDPVPDLTSSPGSNIIWYDDALLTNQVFMGQVFATGETAIGLHTYYLVDSITGCPPSASDTVILTVTGLPPAPLSSDTTICERDSVPDLVAIGTNIIWYDDATLLLLLVSNDSITPTDSIGGVYDFYVTQNPTGCESLADTVLLTINSTTPPLTSDTGICFGSPSTPLIAVGDSINWYSDSAISIFEFQGDSFFPTDIAVGSYTYWATEIDSFTGCESSGDSAVFTVNPIPLPPVASDSNECFGLLMPDLTAVGTSLQWYDTLTLDTVRGTGPNFATGDSAVGSHKYYVTQTVAGCESTPDSATLTIDPIPAAPIASDTAICEGDSVPDLVAVGTNINWYDDGGLTLPLGSNDSITPSGTLGGVYDYYVTQSALGCASLADTVIFTINLTLPPVTTDNVICNGDPSAPLIAVGDSINWYQDSALLIFEFAGDSLFPTDVLVGTYSYFAVQIDSVTGCQSLGDSVTYIINGNPGPPTTGGDTSACFGQAMPDLTAVGASLQWYDNALLDTVVGTGSPFATGDTILGPHKYYVTQTVNGCESAADSATMSVDTLPAPPVTTDTSICFGSPTPDFIAIGANIKWYDDSALTSLVFTGDTFVSGNTALGSYVYYATDSTGGCAGPSSMVTLSITAPPIVPAVADSTFCFGIPTPDLIYVGANTQWYDDAVLTNLVSSADTFVTGDTAVGAHIYYVTDSTSGCPPSVSDTVTITINGIPAMPLTNDTAVCLGDSVPGLIASGTGIQWYSDTALLTLVSSADTFATGNSAPGTYPYFVTQTTAGCTGPADTAVLSIFSTPAPTGTNAGICYGDPVPDLIASGTNILRFQDSGLTTLVFAGDTFSSGDTAVGVYTYYVVDSLNGCYSTAITVTLTINLGLTAPPVASDASACFGAPANELTAIGTFLTWYSDPGLTNVVFIGDTFAAPDTALGAYTYYVTDSVAGCPEGLADTATFTVVAIPAPPLATDSSACFGTTSGVLVASGLGIIRWYSDAGLTNLVGTGDTLVPADTALGSYTY